MCRNSCHRLYRQAIAGVLLASLMVFGCQPDTDSSGDAGPAPPDTVEATPEAGAQRFIGMYRYMADAAVLRDCAGGRLYPVLIEAGHLPLERAYLEQRGEPGAEVLAVFEAEIVMGAPEPGLPEREHLRVTQFRQLLPGQDCPETD